MKNAELSGLFDQMADVMEILGEDRFRINTYRKVGRIIGDLPADVEALLADGALAQVPGIGKTSLGTTCSYPAASMEAHRISAAAHRSFSQPMVTPFVVFAFVVIGRTFLVVFGLIV